VGIKDDASCRAKCTAKNGAEKCNTTVPVGTKCYSCKTVKFYSKVKNDQCDTEVDNSNCTVSVASCNYTNYSDAYGSNPSNCGEPSGYNQTDKYVQSCSQFSEFWYIGSSVEESMNKCCQDHPNVDGCEKTAECYTDGFVFAKVESQDYGFTTPTDKKNCSVQITSCHEITYNSAANSCVRTAPGLNPNFFLPACRNGVDVFSSSIGYEKSMELCCAEHIGAIGCPQPGKAPEQGISCTTKCCTYTTSKSECVNPTGGFCPVTHNNCAWEVGENNGAEYVVFGSTTYCLGDYSFYSSTFCDKKGCYQTGSTEEAICSGTGVYDCLGKGNPAEVCQVSANDCNATKDTILKTKPPVHGQICKTDGESICNCDGFGTCECSGDIASIALPPTAEVCTTTEPPCEVTTEFCNKYKQFSGKADDPEGKICRPNSAKCRCWLDMFLFRECRCDDAPIEVKSDSFDDDIRPQSEKNIIKLAYASTMIVSNEGYLQETATPGYYKLSIPGETESAEVYLEKDRQYLLFIDENKNQLYDEEEEIVDLKENPIEIIYDGTASRYTLNLRRGFNFVSFNELLQSTDSCELIKELAKSTTDLGISQISRFHSGTFEVTSYRKDQQTPVTGKCFPVVPGHGYIIKSDKSYTIHLKSFKLDKPVDLSLLEGWNLVGINGTKKNWTAENLIDAVNASDKFVANNLTRWRMTSSKYDGFKKDLSGNEVLESYGFDYEIDTNEAYFLRVIKGRGTFSIE